MEKNKENHNDPEMVKQFSHVNKQQSNFFSKS
jgi:hypothetical protein